MMENLLVGNIDFLLTINTTEGEHSFNATLKNIEGEFRIYLHFDNIISFAESSIQSKFWNNELSYFSFGKNIQTENARINGKEIELDLSYAKLVTMQTIVSSKGNVFYFIIDTYQYRYKDTDVQDKAIFYLSASSNKLIHSLHLIEYGLEKKENKSIPFKGNIANIGFTILPDLAANPYTAVIQYHRFDSVENVIEDNNILLDLLSFYYGIPIETLLIIVQKNEYTYVIYKQPSYRLMKNSPRNMDLAYLNLYTFNDLAKGITADSSNIKALHTLINDYIKTKYLDNTSAFLILYSILETFADTTSTFFNDKDIMQEVFKLLLDSFIQEMEKKKEKSDDYSKNSSIYEDVKQKWDNLSNELIKKPKKINPIKKLIDDNNIDWEKLNRSFSVKKEVAGIKNIKDLRNAIVHDRRKDYAELLDMKSINSDMSFAVCIILLKKLGINNVGFDKNWEKLSIMK